MGKIFPKLDDKGNTYWVDETGKPIPSLALKDKVWIGADYNPDDRNPDPEKNTSTHKWGWEDRPRVIKWLAPPRFEPWYNKPDSFGISGIRGSGKSALLVSILAAYHARGGSVIDTFQCYDEETEILTKRGWVRFAELNDEDVVATMNPDGYIEYQKPTARQTYTYNGGLISIGGAMQGKRNNSLYDLLVTPNHKLILMDSKSQRITLTAGQLLDMASKVSSHHLPLRVVNSFKWKGEDLSTVDLPAIGKANKILHVKIEPFLKFLGWYIAEGSMRKIGNLKRGWYTWRLTIAEPKEKNRVEIRRCIRELGFNCDEDKNDVWVNSIQLGEMLRELGHASEKFIFGWVKQLPPDKLQIILDSMMKGDGTRWNGQRGCYTTVSRRLADDVSEIALKCGFRVIISFESPTTKTLKDGRVIKGNYRVYHVSVCKTQVNNQIKTSAVTTRPYNGKVYDVTVPNHVLIVRRNGRVVASSNSNDNESLCWLLSPWANDVVLVHGEGVNFKFRDKTYGTILANELDGRNIPSGKIFIITKLGFGREVLYYQFLNDLAYQASHRGSWDRDKIDVWGIREAQEFIGSKLRSTQAYNAKQAQDEFVRFHTQALHSGYAIVYDRARYVAADKDIRELTTWQLFKAQGGQELARNIRWFFKFVTPRFLRHMNHDTALLSGEHGGMGIMQFKFPYWLWNTKHGFSITDRLGISVEYDTEKIRQLEAALKQTESGIGHRKVVTDEVHEEIVRRHIGTTPTAEWRTTNKTNGMSLKDLSIVMHISLPTVTKTWRSHVLRECGCKILEDEMDISGGTAVPTVNIQEGANPEEENA
jgi:hypothetical protein